MKHHKRELHIFSHPSHKTVNIIVTMHPPSHLQYPALHVPLYFYIKLKAMVISIVKDLYAVLESKKCKSAELGTLIWSEQSSEVLDACQLLVTGKNPY